MLDAAGCREQQTPKCRCFHGPVNAVLLRFPGGAFGCSCVKTLVALRRLRVCVWSCIGSCERGLIPIRGGGGTENVNSTVVLQEQTRWPAVPRSCPHYQPCCLCLLTSSLRPRLTLNPNQLYQHDKSAGVTTLLPLPTRLPAYRWQVSVGCWESPPLRLHF